MSNTVNGLGNNFGNAYGGYGNRNPYETGQMNGPYPGAGGLGFGGGLFGQDLEGKSSLILPLAGAALLGNYLIYHPSHIFNL